MGKLHGLKGVNGSLAESEDSPFEPAPDAQYEEINDKDSGQRLGSAKYPFQSATIADRFVLWSVVCEQIGNSWQVVAPLREAGWEINVRSNAPGPAADQKATPGANANGGSLPTTALKLGGPAFNAELNKPLVRKFHDARILLDFDAPNVP